MLNSPALLPFTRIFSNSNNINDDVHGYVGGCVLAAYAGGNVHAPDSSVKETPGRKENPPADRRPLRCAPYP
jgi:hypothetical protein